MRKDCVAAHMNPRITSEINKVMEMEKESKVVEWKTVIAW